MIPEWPSDLPQRFERQGYGAERGDGRLRSNPSTGPVVMRRRSRAVPDPISGRMRMRGAQLKRFHEFYETSIGGGTLAFLFPDPMGGLPILVQWGDEAPKWSNPAGDWWDLGISLDKLWTGTFEPGLPALPPGYSFVTIGGAYLLVDRAPVIVRVPA